MTFKRIGDTEIIASFCSKYTLSVSPFKSAFRFNEMRNIDGNCFMEMVLSGFLFLLNF